MMRIALAAAALVFAAPAAVMAEEPPPLTGASATWTSEEKVELSVTYDGGACEEPGVAMVEAADVTIDIVVIPTYSTAEVCTMQIVPVTYEGVIAVEPLTERLSVLVLDPQGRPVAAGTVDIAVPETEG